MVLKRVVLFELVPGKLDGLGLVLNEPLQKSMFYIELMALMTESYQPAYKTKVQVKMLVEMDGVIK